MYIYARCCKIGLTKTLINLKALQCSVTYTLHDVGCSHLTTQSGEEDKLNRVDIMGNDDELSFLHLDDGNDMVQPILGE
jgi:hypothetical protein